MAGPDVDDATVALLDTFPLLRERSCARDLPGGLTNRNVRVDTPTGSYVLRISSNDGGLLSIDREREFHNTARAYDAGVGAPVVDYRPGEGLLLVGFLPGRTLTAADLDDAKTLVRIGKAVAQLHRGPAFEGRFDMVGVTAHYRSVVAERGYRVPDGYDDHAETVARIAAVLDTTSEGLVPCNNDLLAANFLDDGDHIKIIDYEYAGMNDPCFELGNIWAESFLAAERLDTLVAAYYGRPRPSRVARSRLFALLGRYGWTLWAAIQHGASNIDFDFWTWGMEKYTVAVEEFASTDLERWLTEAAAPD